LLARIVCAVCSPALPLPVPSLPSAPPTRSNAILREIDVAHPAAKSMIELSRTQDEEVGDGTTSVIILSGELLSVSQPFLDRNMHPRHIVGAYVKALDESLSVLDKMCVQLDVTDRSAMMALVRSCIGTKFVSRFGDLVANLAIEAVLKVTVDKGAAGGKEIDIKVRRTITQTRAQGMGQRMGSGE
jgi:T-complex protein 1 subunit gamma